jgi:hypothetical protein
MVQIKDNRVPKLHKNKAILKRIGLTVPDELAGVIYQELLRAISIVEPEHLGSLARARLRSHRPSSKR